MIISSINFVNAEEYPEVTNDIEIRYRWYKEIVGKTGKYVPKKEISSKDIVNENNYKKGTYSGFKAEYCDLSTEDYEIDRVKYITYKKIIDARYVLIENVTYDNNIKIYYDSQLIDFEIMSTEDNKIKIDLKKLYLNELLLFFVDTSTDYKISIYGDQNFINYIISKDIKNEKISIPDSTWVTEKTRYIETKITDIYENSSLTTKLKEENECRYRDILVYKYDIEREYYDDNYYLNVEGYIKDINDYKVFYKGEPITNTIEIPVEVPIEIIKEKIVKEPQIEYVYIEQANNNQENLKENDSSQQQECLPETITETKIQKEIVEKEIPKIPKIIYIIIFVLIIAILILAIKLYKKYVA